MVTVRDVSPPLSYPSVAIRDKHKSHVGCQTCCKLSSTRVCHGCYKMDVVRLRREYKGSLSISAWQCYLTTYNTVVARNETSSFSHI